MKAAIAGPVHVAFSEYKPGKYTHYTSDITLPSPPYSELINLHVCSQSHCRKTLGACAMICPFLLIGVEADFTTWE